MIRPLMPMDAHLSASDGSRALVIVDTYGNIQRLKAVVKATEDQLAAAAVCEGDQ